MKTNPNQKHTDAGERMIVRLYTEYEHPLSELAYLGEFADKSAVRNVLLRHGVKLRPQGSRYGNGRAA